MKRIFLTILGDIKFQYWPPFLYYEKGDYYKASGIDTRDAMDIIQAGDIILRGYNHYLDGVFIPGEYSHTGVYVGNGKMIHSIAEGVSEINIIQFLRCDRFMILRPKFGQEKAIKRLWKWIGIDYDFEFKSGNSALYCHELGAEAYKELNVERKTPYLWKFKFNKMEKTYLAESFIENHNFIKVLEVNSKKKG